MNEHEARAFVATLAAAYPSASLEQASVDLYASQIAQLESASAMAETVRRLVAGGDFFPSIAEIRKTYFPVRRAELAAAAADRGLDEGPPPPIPAEFAEMMASIGQDMPETDLAETYSKLPSAGAGTCDDCCRPHELVRFGPRSLCRACALPRLRVKAQVQA